MFVAVPKNSYRGTKTGHLIHRAVLTFRKPYTLNPPPPLPRSAKLPKCPYTRPVCHLQALNNSKPVSTLHDFVFS